MGAGARTGAVLLLLAAGCSTTAPVGAPPPDAALASPSASGSPVGPVEPSFDPSTGETACPPAPRGRSAFPTGLPADFPADFPAPAGAADAVGAEDDPAVVNVRFPSPLPLSEATAFVVRELPVSGYEVVGGDREPHEADIVFARGELRGQLRIARVDDCTTYWLVQVVRPG